MTAARRGLEQIGAGVHRYADGLVNWYVVEEGGRLALVDTGWPRSWPTIRDAIGRLGHELSDVAAVLLTHGHADHLGSAERARTSCPAPVLVHADEVGRVRGTATGSSSYALVPKLLPQLWRPSAFGFVLHAATHGFLTPTWVKEVTPLRTGERLDVPGHPTVVATPGHTEGHASYHLPDRGILLAGDALVTLDPLTRERGPRLQPDALQRDPARAIASLAALEPLEADLVLPGHGDPWRGSPAEAVRLARRAAAG